MAALRTLVQQRRDARADARELWSAAGFWTDPLDDLPYEEPSRETGKVHSLELEITPP